MEHLPGRGALARNLLDGQGLMSGLSYYVATEHAVAEKRELLKTFTRRLRAALVRGLAKVDAYAAVWSSETGVPCEVSRKTLNARGFAIDAQMIADQQHTVDLYAREGVVPARYDASAGFDASFNV